MRDTRRYLAPRDPKEVLREIADGVLADEGQSVPDWDIVRRDIADELDRQADDLLADARSDYDIFERRRAAAARRYGRVDPAVCVLAGVLIAYLTLLFAGPLFLPEAAANPGLGLTLWFTIIPFAALAVWWPFWRRRRRELMRSVPVAYRSWTNILQNQVLRPSIKEKLNDEERNPRLFDPTIGQNSPPRFTEASEPLRLVETETMTRLRATALNVHSGSLGVSGPRGVGKSTILQFFGPQAAVGRGKDLRLIVPAPVDYESREFIIHLFSRLCEAVLDDKSDALSADGPDIKMESRRHLEELRYLRTYTTNWSASATPKFPFPFPLLFPAITREKAKQRAEQPVTLPELVNSFRDYAARVASWRQSDHDGGRLVIGIDEVDKIRDSDRAEAFLNDIKAIFGVPGSLYLVSLSEEAMASFARRTPSIRGSFDSAFDELIPVGPMTYNKSEELLFKRVTGVPRPFIALCHVLAGGLPRDLVRTVRALVDVTAADGSTDASANGSANGGKSLADTARGLIHREIDSLRQVSLRQLAENDGPGWLLAALDDPSWPATTDDPERPSITPRQFTAAAQQVAGVVRDTGSDQARQLCQELIVSLSFYATTLEVFTDGQDRLIACFEGQKHARPENRHYPIIDDLAKARYAMRVHAGLAHQQLEQYRVHYKIGTGNAHAAS